MPHASRCRLIAAPAPTPSAAGGTRARRTALPLAIAGCALFAGAPDVAAQGSGWSLEIDLPDSVAAAGAATRRVQLVNTFCEGPVYDPATGAVYWTEQKSNQQHWPIWKTLPASGDEKGAVHIQQAYQANGLELDPQGRLVAVQNGRVTRYKPDGSVDTVLVTSGKDGVTFNQANDLSHLQDGSFYFTDLNTKVFLKGADGSLQVAVDGLNGPNGVQVVEEAGLVYVTENRGNQVTRFSRAADGTLTDKQTFVEMQGPDGLEMDAHGNFYIASYSEGIIRVFNGAGQPLGKIAVTGVPLSGGANTGNTSNCAFGGPDNTTLFITGDGGLYAAELKIPGRPRPGTTALVPARRIRSGESLGALPPQGITGRLPLLFRNDPERAGHLPIGTVQRPE